jgi:hypothetical protein
MEIKSKALAAVAHLLDRCQADPRFRHLMSGTISFRMLCEVEAEHTGVSLKEVIANREKVVPDRLGDTPLVVSLDEASYWTKRALRQGTQLGRDTKDVSHVSRVLERELAAEVTVVRATTPEG